MNFLKLRFYIELLAIATGIVGVLYVVPMQIFVENHLRPMTLFTLVFLWGITIKYNSTYQEFYEKWFKKK